MLRTDPGGFFLPAVAGLATGLAILWTFDAGVVGSAAVGAVGFALSGYLTARTAKPASPWPGILLGGCASGLAAAGPVVLLVDLWTNFCIVDCAPPDHGPAVRWGVGVFTGAVAAHTVAGWVVPRRPEPSSPLPDLPD